VGSRVEVDEEAAGQMDELWRARRATSPASLGKVLRSENVVNAKRKELWRGTGHRIDGDEVRKQLEDTILKPECPEE
jgi:hypothetical protein